MGEIVRPTEARIEEQRLPARLCISIFNGLFAGPQRLDEHVDPGVHQPDDALPKGEIGRVVLTPAGFLAPGVKVTPTFQWVTSCGWSTTLTGSRPCNPTPPAPRASSKSPVGSSTENRGARATRASLSPTS